MLYRDKTPRKEKKRKPSDPQDGLISATVLMGVIASIVQASFLAALVGGASAATVIGARVYVQQKDAYRTLRTVLIGAGCALIVFSACEVIRYIGGFYG